MLIINDNYISTIDLYAYNKFYIVDSGFENKKLFL